MGDIYIYLSMSYTRVKFELKGFDSLSYKRYYHRNQLSYIRTKLKAVYHFSKGKDYEQIGTLLGMHPLTIRRYINAYLAGGVEGLCAKTKRVQPVLLTSEQQAIERRF